MKKILLDENLPKRLLYRLLDYGYHTESVRSMEWLSLKNGKLMAKIAEYGFDIFLTSDKKIRYEQNIQKIPFAIVILDVKNLNYVNSIQPILSNIIEQLPKTGPYTLYIIP